jgi:hypothetical protein
MTPARRAALRKAQLASAKKRRKSGAINQARKSISQRRQYRSANKALKATSASHAKRKATRRKIVRRTALGVAGLAVAGAYGAGVVSSVQGRKTRSMVPMRALPGPPRRLGPGKQYGQVRPIKRPTGHLFKTNSKGVTINTTHARQAYNAKRRKR